MLKKKTAITGRKNAQTNFQKIGKARHDPVPTLNVDQIVSEKFRAKCNKGR